MDTQERQRLVETVNTKALYEAGEFLQRTALNGGVVADPEQAKLAAAAAINLVPRGRYGAPMHGAMRARMCGFAFEAVLLMENSETDRLVVFMKTREKGQPYEGQLHCPGTMADPVDFELLPEVDPLSSMYTRLNAKEFGGVLTGYMFVKNVYSQTPEDAGVESKVYIVTAKADPTGGGWYDVYDMPENTVAAHRELIIPAAVKAYRQLQGGN